MKNACIIPARGGSKRIPRKNIKEFRGQPIIKWSIDAAKKSEVFRQIIVSTDDYEIAEIAENCGAIVPSMRPRAISGDYTDTKTVLEHEIEQMDKRNEYYGLICCLYATAPFVRAEDLRNAIRLAVKYPNSAVYPVTKYSYPIQRALVRDLDGTTKFTNEKHANKRSQDLEDRYHDAGQFYIATPERWQSRNNILEGSKTIVLPNWKVQDIDDEEDWVKAEIMHEVIERYEKIT